jgi:Aberrant zinc-finger
MDKHDRPYKCMEPGCDKVQGFTYSGGLLRHQREVHKKNASAKKPLMCPYADCNRSTGNGFTRQENLKEHLRRRHMHTENGASPELPVTQTADTDIVRTAFLPPATVIKRKHDTAETASVALQDEDSNAIDIQNELKRLRVEVQEKDRRLEELKKVVEELQQSVPPVATMQG